MRFLLHWRPGSLFYQWRDKITLKGKEGLAHGQAVLSLEVRRLVAENSRLKKLLAEKKLVLDIKEELLKKKSTNAC